eukprot:40348_1
MSEIHYLQWYGEPIFILAFWCCAIYTLMILSWSMIYFCFNTVQSLHKLSSGTSSSCGAVLDGSKCCNQTTYALDVLNSCSDVVLTLCIVSNSSLAANPYLWTIFCYISGAVFVIGVVLLVIKFKLLSTFYPNIIKWRKSIDKISTGSLINNSMTIQKWITIKYKHKKISLLLKHQIMFDLFSASLQDSVQASVIFYVLADLQFTHDDDAYGWKLHHNGWQMDHHVFHWILILKLILCLSFMMYKLVRVIGIECGCHEDRIRHPGLKYRTDVNGKSYVKLNTIKTNEEEECKYTQNDAVEEEEDVEENAEKVMLISVQ